MQHLFKIVTILLLLAACINAGAQSTRFYEQALQQPYHLSVNDQKTTVLIFPAPIAANGVDRGTGDILAKTVTGVDNILKIKGATPSFAETNLTVVTTDGKVYAFTVDYSPTSDDKPIDMGKQLAQEAAVAFFKSRRLNDQQVESLSKTVASTHPFMKRPRERSFKMQARLTGIYICKDVVFYRVTLTNKSPIDYDLDFMRFYVRDQKRMKRTAEQEKELQPLFVYQQTGGTTAANATQTIVAAFTKFTIADKKNFILQFFERGGDRHLQLKMSGKDIIKARPLAGNL